MALFSALALTLGMAMTPLQSQAQEAPKVKIATNMGDIMVELYPDKAPKTVANFLQYAKDKHYNGTIFHRVIANFMIQGGGFTQEMTRKQPNAPILNEADNCPEVSNSDQEDIDNDGIDDPIQKDKLNLDRDKASYIWIERAQLSSIVDQFDSNIKIKASWLFW